MSESQLLEIESTKAKAKMAFDNHDYSLSEECNLKLLQSVDIESDTETVLEATAGYLWSSNQLGRGNLAIPYANKVLEFVGIETTSKVANLHVLLGSYWNNQGEAATSLEHCQAALTIYENEGDFKGQASVSDKAGLVYRFLQDYTRSLEYHQRALEICVEHGLNDLKAGILSNIGNVHSRLGDEELALAHYLDALPIAQSEGNKTYAATITMNVGTAYAKLGQLESAIQYFKDALVQSVELKNKSRIGLIKGNLARLFAEPDNPEKDLVKAEKYFVESAEVLKSTGEKSIVFIAMDALTTFYSEQERWKEALDNLQAQNELSEGFRSAEALQRANEFDEARRKAETEKELAIERALASQRLDMLHNTLPEEIAERIVDGETEIADQFDEVTVLFTDFKGFTRMSELLSPKELVKDLHECFSKFDRICDKHGIEKIKTIGDAYMAAGGLPVPNTTHAKDVTQAALEMAKVVELGKADKIAKNLPFFEIRVGVHTGPVVAGIVGLKKYSYDIWGDTVNTASRMESSGGVGKVNISQATYALLNDDTQFSFEGRGKIEAKGKGEMEMYFVEMKA